MQAQGRPCARAHARTRRAARGHLAQQLQVVGLVQRRGQRRVVGEVLQQALDGGEGLVFGAVRVWSQRERDRQCLRQRAAVGMSLRRQCTQALQQAAGRPAARRPAPRRALPSNARAHARALRRTSSSERPSSATLRSVWRKAQTMESMMSLIWGPVILSMHEKQCCGARCGSSCEGRWGC